MTDDIVTRLRGSIPGNPDYFLELISNAADEIERLRAEVARLGSFLHPIGMTTHEQAVRGD